MHVQVIANCIHVPYQDSKALDMFAAFCQMVQPDEIHLLGDIMDCGSLSTKFSPPRDEKLTRIKFEIAATKDLLGRFRDLDLLDDTQMYYHGGNHEDRMRRWVEKYGPQLLGLTDLEVPSLLDLENLGYKYYPYNTLVQRGKLHLTHGNLVRKKSAYTASGMLEKYGVPILFGHTHRGGVHYRTDARDTLAAWENFCLCRFDMPYLAGPPNWQHGWSVVYNDNKRRFHVVQVPVVGYRYVFEGMEYTAPTDRITRGLRRAK